jgi:uncharacterized protein
VKLALGTVQYGLNYGISNQRGRVNRLEIEKIKSLATESNINLLDTAQAYGNSETIIGEVFDDSFRVVSKLQPGVISREVERSIESTLKILKRDKIYAILFHEFNDYYSDQKSYDILREYKEKGRIEKIGFSLYYPHELDLLLDNDVSFDIIQIPFNIFDQRFKPYFARLKQLNVEIHVRSIFLQGLVFIRPKYLSPHFNDFLSLFEDFHKKVDQSEKSIEDVCINYVNNCAHIDNIVVGVSSSQELKSNIASINNYCDRDSSFYESFNCFGVEDKNIILPFNWK